MPVASRSRRRLRVLVGVAAICAVAVLALAATPYAPFLRPPGSAYFAPSGTRELQWDERAQWNWVLSTYATLAASGDTFPWFDEETPYYWGYAIAFTAYGLPSIAAIAPSERERVHYYLSVMIEKMKSKRVWEGWILNGHGDDPISKHNIMYKGHLNLMYGLFQLVTGDTRYAREYTWLTQRIALEMRKHHEDASYEGACCHPDRWFVQCNAVSMLSLRIYDVLFGTDYTSNEVRWTLEFIQRRMTDPVSGLYFQEFHPTFDGVDDRISGNTIAMAILFLHEIDPEGSERAYRAWKSELVHEVGPFAWVSEVPGGSAGPLATEFGLWAAKEVGDVELFTKLRNSLDGYGRLTVEGPTQAGSYAALPNYIANGGALGAKAHVGWKALLAHPRPNAAPTAIPDTAGMTWKDVLPQEIHRRPPR
jgi:hypothetical protein